MRPLVTILALGLFGLIGCDVQDNGSSAPDLASTAPVSSTQSNIWCEDCCDGQPCYTDEGSEYLVFGDEGGVGDSNGTAGRDGNRGSGYYVSGAPDQNPFPDSRDGTHHSGWCGGGRHLCYLRKSGEDCDREWATCYAN